MSQRLDDLYRRQVRLLKERGLSPEEREKKHYALQREWQAAFDLAPQDFARWLPRMPTSSDALFEVYEALAEKEPEPEELLASEFSRLMDEFERSGEQNILSTLGAYSFLNLESERPLQREILTCVLAATRSPRVEMRRFAAALSLGLLETHTPELNTRLREMVDADPDPEVRWRAWGILRDLSQEVGFGVPPSRPAGDPPPGFAPEARPGRSQAPAWWPFVLAALLAFLFFLRVFH